LQLPVQEDDSTLKQKPKKFKTLEDAFDANFKTLLKHTDAK